MFAGIVQGTGRLTYVRDTNGIRTFAIEFADRFTDDLAIGGSVAVDGVCLTATTPSMSMYGRAVLATLERCQRAAAKRRAGAMYDQDQTS